MDRVKLIRLNEVQFADTAERVADLVFAGFEPVNEKKAEPRVAAEEVTETEEAEETSETEEEKPKKRGKKE